MKIAGFNEPRARCLHWQARRRTALERGRSKNYFRVAAAHFEKRSGLICFSQLREICALRRAK
jgi:hypothetical protein